MLRALFIKYCHWDLISLYFCAWKTLYRASVLYLWCFLCQLIRSQSGEGMMQPHRPEHNNKCNTKYWVNKLREGFQTLDTIFVSFLHSFVFIELLQSLLLPLFINVDQLMMPMEKLCRGTTDPGIGIFLLSATPWKKTTGCRQSFEQDKAMIGPKFDSK